MMGNYHVRFLGGKGVVTPLTYPVYKRKGHKTHLYHLNPHYRRNHLILLGKSFLRKIITSNKKC